MIVIAKIKSKSGSEKEMEGALVEMVKKVAGEEGTLLYTLHRLKDDPKTFLLYEQYKDDQAFIDHSGTPYFKALFKTLKPLLDGAPIIEMYDEIAKR
ncbi:MAG: antibiotic biosynthesis monooxygenase [Proteobacteria bacterium]|nr:antibiotic biosynthesis monooxygenase [Pseudomonadota bacterium]